MSGNDRSFQDDQSAEDKREQAEKDMPRGKDRDSENED